MGQNYSLCSVFVVSNLNHTHSIVDLYLYKLHINPPWNSADMAGDQTVTLHFPRAFCLDLDSIHLCSPVCLFRFFVGMQWLSRVISRQTDGGVIKCSFAIYFLFYVLLYSFPKPFKCLWTLDEIKRVAIKARLLHLMFISTLRRSILN